MQTIPPPGTAPPRFPALPPAPPAPVRRTRSVLGRLVLSLAVFAAGLVVLVDVAGPDVPGSVYLAVPLAVVAAGLIVGAWYGRARGLIAVGVVLSVLLAISLAAEGSGWTHHQPVTWQPIGITQLQSTYRMGAGNATLDLSGVDFTGQTRTLEVHVSVGNLHIILPSTVDVDVRAKVEVGNATVLGQTWNGIGQSEHSVIDNGTDGPGGGSLTLTATVNVGDLEVRR